MIELNSKQIEMLEGIVEQGKAADLDAALEFAILKAWNDSQEDPAESAEEIAEIRRRVAAMREGRERIEISSKEQFVERIKAKSAALHREEVAS